LFFVFSKRIVGTSATTADAPVIYSKIPNVTLDKKMPRFKSRKKRSITSGARRVSSAASTASVCKVSVIGSFAPLSK
jgi:hypothetical protein